MYKEFNYHILKVKVFGLIGIFVRAMNHLVSPERLEQKGTCFVVIILTTTTMNDNVPYIEKVH